ncbi:MAG: hypothetical protein Q4E10_01530 [Porphyromonas sp.]|nr:hypothetical protein [Porphyromonas sp.]
MNDSLKDKRIGLFIPCYIDAIYPEVGIATYNLDDIEQSSVKGAHGPKETVVLLT